MYTGMALVLTQGLHYALLPFLQRITCEHYTAE
jgi:hypothetical protein